MKRRDPIPPARDAGARYAQVYEVVKLIPKGQVMSYSGIARQMGRPGLQRMVGYALRSLAGSDHDVPWWRVVNAQGRISNAYGPETQRERLRAEGITVSDDLLLDLPAYDAEELVSARLQARRARESIAPHARRRG
jgi:methylated-DNA-protein-cysteine methyltransferase-like protein